MLSNDNIIEYLDYYVNCEYSLEYAVLLKGTWGCGKTWFIDEYLKKQKIESVLKTSLYGVTSTGQIDKDFFQQLYPIRASKGFKIATKIISGIASAAIKFDVDGDGKGDGSISVKAPDLKLDEKFDTSGDCLLIFDDLERCKLPLSDVLGYINHFVEIQGCKAIIIANEKEIVNDQNYSKIKEKLVGKTFEVQVDLAEIITTLINELTDLSLKQFLLNNISAVIDLQIQSTYSNIRIIKQALWDWERVFKQLSDVVIKNNELMLHFFQLFFIFTTEVKHGNLNAEDITSLYDLGWMAFIEEDKETDNTFNKLDRKYGLLVSNYSLIPASEWSNVIDKGIINDNVINSQLEQSKYFTDKQTNWKKLWHCLDLSDDEFVELEGKVFNDISDPELTEVYEITHIAGLLFHFSNEGLSQFKEIEIKAELELKVKWLYETDKLPSDYHTDETGYAGLGYMGIRLDIFNQFCGYIKNKITDYKKSQFPKLANELLENTVHDASIFNYNLVYHNSKESQFYDIPILNYIAPKDFVECLFQVKGNELKFIGDTFKKRYNHPEKLTDELQWLIDVKRELLAEREKSRGKLSYYKFKWVVNALEHAISVLENIKGDLLQ